jgi:hypothetical protein
MSSRSSSNDRRDMLEIYQKFQDTCDFKKVGKLLGKGAFGEVRDITYKKN